MGKQVIITKTGRPDEGVPRQNARPSEESAIKLFKATANWSEI